MTKIAVIGAIPAGLSATYELTKAGYQVNVYEASGGVGGMAGSIQIWGQTVDIGPHRFFSKDAKVNRLWLEVANADYVMVNRLKRLYYNSQLFQYPLRPFGALWKLGPFEAFLCLVSYFNEQIKGAKPEETDNFKDWVVQNFGKRLYEHFFKGYSEKLWGNSARQLDKEFAVQRIKNLNLWEAVKNLFSSGCTKHKTLLDRFSYLVYGTGMIYDRMAEYIKQNGNQKFLKVPINQIKTYYALQVTGLVLNNGREVHYDPVNSSIPITLLVQSLPNVRASLIEANQQLKSRNTILVNLQVDHADFFPDNWLYINSKELRFGLITNFRNWSEKLYGQENTTILALEYWCSFEDDFWQKPEKELIALATEELRKTQIIDKTPNLDGYVYRIPCCYPIYEKGYKENLDVVKGYLDQISGLQAIGRYGAFNYTNQDHSILMGILAAQNITKENSHDLWKINSEAQYQDDSLIDEQGIVMQ